MATVAIEGDSEHIAARVCVQTAKNKIDNKLIVFWVRNLKRKHLTPVKYKICQGIPPLWWGGYTAAEKTPLQVDQTGSDRAGKSWY